MEYVAFMSGLVEAVAPYLVSTKAVLCCKAIGILLHQPLLVKLTKVGGGVLKTVVPCKFLEFASYNP